MGGKFSFLSSTHSQKTISCLSCRFQSVLREFLDIRNVYKDNFDFLERSSQKRLQCHNKSFRLFNICRKCPSKVLLILQIRKWKLTWKLTRDVNIYWINFGNWANQWLIKNLIHFHSRCFRSLNIFQSVNPSTCTLWPPLANLLPTLCAWLIFLRKGIFQR